MTIVTGIRINIQLPGNKPISNCRPWRLSSPTNVPISRSWRRSFRTSRRKKQCWRWSWRAASTNTGSRSWKRMESSAQWVAQRGGVPHDFDWSRLILLLLLLLLSSSSLLFQNETSLKQLSCEVEQLRAENKELVLKIETLQKGDDDDDDNDICVDGYCDHYRVL